ncbi:MAG: hypothetical protein ACFFC7_12990 [Candidatus Hermodarchaeota archaeon]
MKKQPKDNKLQKEILFKDFPDEFFTEEIEIKSWNTLKGEYIFHIRTKNVINSQIVKRLLKVLYKQTWQSYVALYNPKSGYLLVTIRG